MNIMSHTRVLAFACMSYALGACAMVELDEADMSPAAGVSVQEEDEDVASASEAISKPGGEGSDAVGCGGGQNWCLVKCSKTGSHLHVVGTWNQLGGACAGPGEKFCNSHKLGYRTSACWGYVNNQ
jgi:hypothetical protein